MAQLREVRDRIEACLLNNESIAKPPAVGLYVRVDKFSNSSIDIAMNCFTKITIMTEFLEIKEELAYAVKEIVEGAGCDFAFPSGISTLKPCRRVRPRYFHLLAGGVANRNY